MSRDEFSALLAIELAGPATCDAGRLLRELVTACADANMQEADESEERPDEEDDGEIKLFLAATTITNGYRWKHREER